MRTQSNSTYEEFIKDLSSDATRDIKSGFRDVPRVFKITGPEKLFRFAGFSPDGNSNNPKGSWWMSDYQYTEYQERANRMNVNTSDFVKFKIALSKGWNDMSNLFELNVPGGSTLDALIGTAASQPFLSHDLTESEQGNFQYGKIVFIGGAEQIYIKAKDIEKYSVQQVFNW